MAKAAVMGYGTVGSGVVTVLNTNADIIAKKAGEPIEVKYILDIRKFPGDPMEDRIIDDFTVIENDPEISVVAEVMGGTGVAYEFTKRALKAGKSVCTSNKALVAEYGPELCAIAEENGVSYLYEASCGGGIPIIRPLRNALTADKILAIGGIFNGTTNYILTKMEKEGLEYADVLKMAQDMGYAERDPSADVDGWDTCRKLAILGSIAYDTQISYKDIRTEGISAIDAADIRYAQLIEKRIKLLAVSRNTDEGIYAVVIPAMIGADLPLYAVDDVFNAVLVKGNMLDDVMFYGQGAGKDATGSAVVSDIVDVVVHKGKCGAEAAREKCVLLPAEDMTYRFFGRVKGDYDTVEKAAAEAFGDVTVLTTDEVPGECAFVTGAMTEAEFTSRAPRIPGFEKFIRILI